VAEARDERHQRVLEKRHPVVMKTFHRKRHQMPAMVAAGFEDAVRVVSFAGFVGMQSGRHAGEPYGA
jgi:hypothetical protein